jgi:hypothetical protein
MKDDRSFKFQVPSFKFESNDLELETWNLKLIGLEAMKGVEPLSTGLQDRRSVIQLSYIATNKFQVPSFRFQISESGVVGRNSPF